MEKKKSFDNLLIVGRNPVKEAIKVKKVTRICLSESFNDASLLSLAKENHIPVQKINNHELERLAKGENHQGVIAYIKPYEYRDLNSIISLAKKKNDVVPIIVVLDGITDPQNMGTILRSCDVFGVSGVIISKHHQAPITSSVFKTSAGAINYIPIALVNNLNQVIDTLKKEGFWVMSSDASAKINYQDVKYDFPIVLIIGSEGYGVSSLLLKNSDYVVKIPQFGHVNSLNASVATGIFLSRIRNR